MYIYIWNHENHGQNLWREDTWDQLVVFFRLTQTSYRQACLENMNYSGEHDFFLSLLEARGKIC